MSVDIGACLSYGFERLKANPLYMVVGILVIGLCIAVGTMLCVVPGLLIAPLAWISLYLVAAGEKDGVNAFKRAWTIVTSNLVALAIPTIVISIVGGLGSLACGIGILATVPIAMAGLYKMAQTAVATSAPQPTALPPGPGM